MTTHGPLAREVKLLAQRMLEGKHIHKVEHDTLIDAANALTEQDALLDTLRPAIRKALTTTNIRQARAILSDCLQRKLSVSS